MQEAAKKKGLSAGAKWGIGCGSGCLVLAVVLIVLGVAGFTFIKGKLGAWQEEFAALGFDEVKTGQVLEAKETITVPTLYVGQTVKITADATTNLAIVAQMAEIHGRVAGTVYFRGQVLMVKPGAKIEGDLDLAAQSVVLEGEVKGEVRGTYQSLQGE